MLRNSFSNACLIFYSLPTTPLSLSPLLSFSNTLNHNTVYEDIRFDPVTCRHGHTYTQTHTHTDTHKQTHTHTHTHTHTRTHTHTHTHTHTRNTYTHITRPMQYCVIGRHQSMRQWCNLLRYAARALLHLWRCLTWNQRWEEISQ